ncbi:MAG: hypothetical protein HY353_00560 [Candidatus Omnitrophica bacterium]|nr:hypothetical protein [Candidatus Omnitrophota bacterium]
MFHRLALTGFRRLTNRRGAAFLLAVYFASLMLLLLGGVSLQRTIVDVRASQVSRDVHQSYWAADAAFDRAMTVLRASQLPAFNDSAFSDGLGCSYGSFTFNETGGRGDYAICKTTNPDQFAVELMGRSPTATEVWVSGLIERKIPQVTLSHAVVGLEDLTLSKATVGGVNSRHPTHPLTFSTVGFAPDGFNDGFGYRIPRLTQAFNDKGHIATKSTRQGALSILNHSQVYGAAMAGTPGTLTVDSTATITETASGTTSVVLTEFPPVQEPSTATPLQQVMPTSFVDNRGNVTMTGQSGILEQGTYQAKDLTLEDSRLATNGPVDLFVVGSLTVTRSNFYGTPLLTDYYGSVVIPSSYLSIMKLAYPDYSPPNLRIFIRPADGEAQGDWVRITKGSLVAGILYAPAMRVKIDRKSMLLGGVVSKTAQIGLLTNELEANTETFEGTKVYYDQAVSNMPFKPRPESPLPQVLFYHINKDRRANASNRSTGNQERLAQWFNLVDGKAVVGTPTPAPVSGGGGGYSGGGCNGGGILPGY